MYNPSPFSGKLDDLPIYIEQELRNISAVFSAALARNLETLYVEPPKPREGMVCVADGTEWNPGAGAGVYAYYSGSWNKLG